MKEKAFLILVSVAIVLSGCMFVLPASAMADDDNPHLGIPVLVYDADSKALVPMMGAINLGAPTALYSYEGEYFVGYFVLRPAMDTQGNGYVAHISYGPRTYFAEAKDLQTTREAIREFTKTNGLKAKSYGALTEKIHQNCEALPADKLTVLLYPAETTV